MGMASLSVRVACRHMAARVGKSLAAVVASRYIQAMDLDKWPAKKQLAMLKDEYRRISNGKSSGHNDSNQARNAAWYMKGVAGWEIEALAGFRSEGTRRIARSSIP
jgi:hypothetical protein